MIRKKMTLEIEETEIDFHVVGIVSSTSHLEFVHFLNKAGIFNFERMDDLCLKDKSEDKFFIRFEFAIDELEQRFVLIKNLGDKGILDAEFKGIDYLLLVFGELGEELDDIIKQLKEQFYIQVVMNYEKDRFKDKTLRKLNA